VADPKRILIVRPSALGDVCRTVPVLVTLRAAYPDARIEWVVQEEYAAAIRAHPALDEAVLFPRARFAHWWRSPRIARELARWFTALRARGYDLVIDSQGLGRSGLMTWATGARRRVGPRWAREFGWLGYNVSHARPRARHTVEEMMSLLVAEGLTPVYDMRLYPEEADRTWWHGARRALSCGSPYAVLAPTSRWPSKRWPREHWVRIIDPLVSRGFRRLVLVGSPAERGQVAGIAEAGGETVLDLVGATTLGRSMAIIADADLVIANDSAPLHMAVGLDRPCLGLFGPTDPEEVGPFRRSESVLRAAPGRPVSFKERRLGDALMRRIEPRAVLARVDRLLAPRADRYGRDSTGVLEEAVT
jgi:lipopolysaccharide heptosyltransferase I